MSARKAAPKTKAKGKTEPKPKTSGTQWGDDDYEAAGYGRITLRLPQADLDLLAQLAKAAKRSRSAVISQALRALAEEPT
jgi:Ribbon-helix-helix protein, copG family